MVNVVDEIIALVERREALYEELSEIDTRLAELRHQFDPARALPPGEDEGEVTEAPSQDARRNRSGGQGSSRISTTSTPSMTSGWRRGELTSIVLNAMKDGETYEARELADKLKLKKSQVATVLVYQTKRGKLKRVSPGVFRRA